LIEGRIWKYGDHVNTDLIIPGRYLDNYDVPTLAEHAMEDIDPLFVSKVRRGDILVAGRNFGCGSSREQAPLVLKEKGVGAIVAVSFARIFYRNAINIGLPVVVADLTSLDEGDVLSIDLSRGLLRSASGWESSFRPLPPQLLELLEKGGLVSSLRERFKH